MKALLRHLIVECEPVAHRCERRAPRLQPDCFLQAEQPTADTTEQQPACMQQGALRGGNEVQRASHFRLR